MSLHSKARNTLFQDFLKKNYQNIDSKMEKELDSIDPDNIIANKIELNALKRVFKKINFLDYNRLNYQDLLQLIHQNFYTKFIFIIQKNKNKQWQMIHKVGKSPATLCEEFEEKIKKYSFKPRQIQRLEKESIKKIFNITEASCQLKAVFVDKKLSACIIYRQKEKNGFLKDDIFLSFFISQLENKIKTDKLREKNEIIKSDFNYFKKEIQKYFEFFLSAIDKKEKKLEVFLQKLKIEDVLLLKKEGNDLIPINNSLNISKIQITTEHNLTGYLTGKQLDYFATALKEFKKNIKTLYLTSFAEEKNYFFLFFNLSKNYFKQKRSEIFLLKHIFYLIKQTQIIEHS